MFLASAMPRHAFQGWASRSDSSGVALSPVTQPNMCLGTIQAPANDVELYLGAYNITSSFCVPWEIHPGNNPSVRWSGTKYCAGPPRRAHLNSQTCLTRGDPNASSQLFDINKGAGAVKTTGSNFCLDSTTQFPPNGRGLKLWTCYSGLPQQNWYYTGDNHIAITGGTACADVKREDGTTFQVWSCSGTDPQQVFTTSAQT
ncbi:hypothetical protein JCM24511_09364 [Saitozyma sp. JCM 24511]|nr:hypothetical protein JCM24511_09364 [Saitozyma sp. JCM 24511]